jgi:hypothetical protein
MHEQHPKRFARPVSRERSGHGFPTPVRHNEFCQATNTVSNECQGGPKWTPSASLASALGIFLLLQAAFRSCRLADLTVSTETARRILHQAGITWQRTKTWKAGRDPDFATKMTRILDLYDRNAGVRQMFATLDLATGLMFYRFRDRKRWPQFLDFCTQLRQRFPTGLLCLICDNYGPHGKAEVTDWCATHGIELVYTPSNASWLNRIESEFTALRYFTLDGSDYTSHQAQETTPQASGAALAAAARALVRLGTL